MPASCLFPPITHRLYSEDAATAPYRLLAGFPPAEISNFDRTLDEAGLKNVRISQMLV